MASNAQRECQTASIRQIFAQLTIMFILHFMVA